MRLSTRSRYGLRALLDIATHSRNEPVRLREIAKRQEVSLSYLEHIVGPLIQGGILRSTRGPSGGVSLLRRPEEVPLGEVMQLLEGPMTTTDCVLHPELCARADHCATRSLWSELTDAMQAVLREKTLAHLMRGYDTDGRGDCVPEDFGPMRTRASGQALRSENTGGDRS